MHAILDLPDPNIVGIKLSGTLTEDDYEAIVPHMEDVFEAHLTTRILFVLDDVDGWDPDERWTDWAFDIRHAQEVDKAAVVGDDPWEQWVEKVNLLFPGAQVHTYEDEDEALDWIRGDMEVPGVGPGSAADPTAGAQDESEE